MLTYNDKKYVTTAEAANIIGRSVTALNQLLHRGKLASKKVGNRRFLPYDEVANYFPNKKRLPNLTDTPNLPGGFVGIDQVCQQLHYTKTHLINLIRKKKLDGYCAPDGVVYVSQISIDKFLGVFNDSTEDISDI